MISSIEKIISSLNDEVTQEDVVVVEGRRDEAALRSAGFKGSIVTLSRFGGETKLIDKISRSKCVFLLLDLDEEGEEITDRLTKKLQERGCKVDRSLREIIGKETRGRIRRIEELSKWVPYLTSEYL